MATIRIDTEYWAKPIPLRQFDWSAVDGATYDGEGCPIGYGRTESEAIADLLEQISESNDDEWAAEADALIKARAYA